MVTSFIKMSLKKHKEQFGPFQFVGEKKKKEMLLK